MEIGT